MISYRQHDIDLLKGDLPGHPFRGNQCVDEDWQPQPGDPCGSDGGGGDRDGLNGNSDTAGLVTISRNEHGSQRVSNVKRTGIRHVTQIPGHFVGGPDDDDDVMTEWFQPEADHYSTMDYINAYVENRGMTLDEAIDVVSELHYVDDVDGAMTWNDELWNRTTTLPDEVVLFRGSSSNDAEGDDYEQGDVIEPTYFMSTSLDENTAASFSTLTFHSSGDHSTTHSPGNMHIIRAPAGIEVIAVDDGEEQVILAPGYRMVVERVHDNINAGVLGGRNPMITDTSPTTYHKLIEYRIEPTNQPHHTDRRTRT